MAEHVRGSPVDPAVARATALVAERSVVAHARDDEPRLDLAEALEVLREPRERSEGAGAEEQPVRASQAAALELASYDGKQGDPGHVVVGERGVADVRREEDFLVTLAGEHGLGVRQAAVGELGVDHDLVPLVGHDRRALVLRDAEAPRVGPVGGPVGDPVRMLRQRVKVLGQLRPVSVARSGWL